MYEYTYPIVLLSNFSKIPVETLRTWQRAHNRAGHCELIEAAYQRGLHDAKTLDYLTQDNELHEFAEYLGFATPFLKEIAVPASTLRQWEKDGDSFRVRIILLGHQTLCIKDICEKSGVSFDEIPISSASLIRLISADMKATLTLLEKQQTSEPPSN